MPDPTVVINIDGAARGNPGPSGYGVSAANEAGDVLAEAYGYLGDQTNNFAEYIALLAALAFAKSKGWRRLIINSDSQLMVKQMSGQYKVKNLVLAGFHRQAREQRKNFDYVSIRHVRREFNKEADRLANIAVDKKKSVPANINPLNEPTGTQLKLI